MGSTLLSDKAALLAAIRKRSSGWHLLLLPFAVLLLAIPFVVHANRVALHLNNQTTDPEASLVQIGLWAAQSGRLYPPLAEKPFTPAPHGPAYYELLRFLAAAAPADFQALAYKARLLSFVMFLLVCFELSVIARRLGVSPLLCVIPAVIFCTVPSFYPWSASARPDMLALFLNVTAMLCFCWPSEARFQNSFAAGLFAGAAVVFKQSMAASAVAIGLALLLHRRWKHLLAFCAAAAVVPFAVFGFLLLRREPLLDELLIMRFFAHDPLSAAHLVSYMLRSNPSYLALLSLGTCGCVLLWRRNSPRFRALALYCGFAWLFGFFTILNVGGAENYLLEGWLALSLASALTLDEWRLRWEAIPGAVRYPLVLFLLLTVPWQTLDCLHLGDAAVDQDVLTLVRGKRVLSDQPYLAVQGADPELLDSYTTTQLELHGQWSSRPIQDQLRHRWFDLAILRLVNGSIYVTYRGYPYLSREIITAIGSRYKPLCVLKGATLVLFVPNDEVDARRIDPGTQRACLVDLPDAIPSDSGIRAASP